MKRAALTVLRIVFGRHFLRGFSVELWDGTRVPASGAERFVLAVRDPGALRAAFKPPVDLNAARAFAAGLLDVEGDMEAAVDAMFQAMTHRRNVVRLLLALRKLPKVELPPLREANLKGKVHSIDRDRAAIGFHYDQPVAFYKTFLDAALSYSCAYFDDGIETLEEAQRAKIDHSLRKLRLRPGERLLDIGCGWGALAIQAASEYGATVLGVTLSERQVEEARRRIAAAGFDHLARIELRDYREIEGPAFDKIVSVGMFEHVGARKLAEYFSAANRLLRPGGLFLNHGIATQVRRGDGKAGGFIDRFIFPDGELVSVSHALGVAERCGFEVRDVENLREHYTRTLRAWVANLEANGAAAIDAAGEQSYRAWRLYLAGSAQGFRSGRLGVFQSLLAKPGEGGEVEIPPTRRDLYEPYSARTFRAS